MKTKSKLLTLLLVLTLLCGLFAVIVSSAATPEGGAEKTMPTPWTDTPGLNNTTNRVTDEAKVAANEECFGRSGVVTAVDGQQRFRYVAASTIYNNATTMNPTDSFFKIGTPFKQTYSFDSMTYFTYEMDVSFEGIPAGATMSLNVRYNKTADGSSPTNGGYITFSNVNGKLEISAPDKSVYPVHLDELEWVHIAWVVKINKDANKNATNKCPATLYINGEPFYTYDVENSTGFFNQNTIFQTGDLRLQPAKSATENFPGSTLLFQNYKSYVFTTESGELDAFANGEKSMKTSAGTYKQVVYDNTYTYPTSARTAVASVGATKYGTVEEAIAAANGGTVTLLTHITDTVDVNAPCTIDTQGMSFAYTTSHGVTKNENTLTFANAEDENVMKFVFTLNGETLGTKSYGLGAIPDVTASGTSLFWDAYHFYKGDSRTINGEAATEWTMPTEITADDLGKTVAIDLIGAKQVFATLAFGSTVKYYYVVENGTSGEDMVADLLVDSKTASNGAVTVTYYASVANSCSIDLDFGNPSTVDIYVDINGQTLDGFYLKGTNTATGFFAVKTEKTMYIYSSKPGAVVKTTANFTYNYSRSNTFNIGALVKDGVWCSGNNLTVYAARLFNNGTYKGAAQKDTYNVNGGTYHLTDHVIAVDNYASVTSTFRDAKISFANGSLLSSPSAERTMNTTVTNCEIRCTGTGGIIATNFKAKGAVTLSGCKLYGLTPKVPTIEGLTLTLGADTTLTDAPAEGVLLANGTVLARIPVQAVDGYLPVYRVVPVSRTATVTRATETNPETGDILDSETTLWEVGNLALPDGLDYHFTHGTEDVTKVMFPMTWTISDGTNTASAADFRLAAGTSYTVKPATYEERFVSLTVTDKNGIMTVLTEGTEAELHTATESTKADLLLRLYNDFTTGDHMLVKQILLNGANMQFDMNGHKIYTERNQSGLFCANAANGTVYVYSSRAGALIQMLKDRKTEQPSEANGNVTIEWGGGFAFAPKGGSRNMTVGRTKDGKTFARANLTVEGACLFQIWGATYIVDSITHNAWRNDNTGVIQLQADNGTLDVINCDIKSSIGATALIGHRMGTKNWKITFENCNISSSGAAALTGKNSKSGEFTAPEILFKNTVLVMKDENTTVDPLLPITFGEGTKTNVRPASENIKLSTGTEYARTSDGVTFNGKQTQYEVTKDAVTAEWTHGDVVLAAEFWKKGSIPTFEGKEAFGDFYFAAAKAGSPINENHSYNLKLRSKVSKILGNLTLYSNISFNLYLNDEAIKAVTVKIPDAENEGATKTLTLDLSRTDTRGDVTYNVYTLSDISPKDLTKTFEISLTLENGEDTYTYNVTTSLAVYAKSVLEKAEECDEGKLLVASLIRYVREAALYFGTAEETDPVMQEFAALLAAHNYEEEYATWDGKNAHKIESGNTLLTGAALNLGNNPGFFFSVGAGVTEVTVTYGDTILTFTGEDIKTYGSKDGILVNTIHASEFCDVELVVTATKDGVTETVRYNLDTYIQGVMDKNSQTTAPAYADALYAYSVAAKAYLNRNNH